MIRFGVEALSLSAAVAKALLVFASQDDTRPVLCSVAIDCGDLCATDGHAAIRFEQVEIEPGAEPPHRYNRRVFLRSTVEAAIKRAAGGVVRLPWAELAPESVRSAQIRQAEPREGFPREAEPVGFSAALLSKLEAAARACRRERVEGEIVAPDDPPAVLVALGDRLSPARFQIGGVHWHTAAHTAQVSIMPMRCGGDEQAIRDARDRVRHQREKEQERQRKAEQRQRDRERAKVVREERERKRQAERERVKAARDEAKRIRARDRAERMPRREAAAAE